MLLHSYLLGDIVLLGVNKEGTPLDRGVDDGDEGKAMPAAKDRIGTAEWREFSSSGGRAAPADRGVDKGNESKDFAAVAALGVKEGVSQDLRVAVEEELAAE